MTGGAIRSAVVTGGAGFIGRRIVGALVARGAEVTVVDDLSGGDAAGLPRAAELLVQDVADAGVIDALARAQPGLVVHAAAQVSVPLSVADPARDRAVNVDGTRNVIAGARQGGAQKLVFLSSGGAVYGEAESATEATEPNPQSPYGAHKLEAEQLVAASGLPYANLRLANIYGPGQRAGLEGGVVAIFVEQLRAGVPIDIYGDGSQTRDFTYVDDVVAAVLAAADQPQIEGTWNVSTGRRTSLVQLLEELERLIRPAAKVTHVPPRAGDVQTSGLSPVGIERALGWRPRYFLADGLVATVAA
jgi:UDP-glucose 4-epimerase